MLLVTGFKEAAPEIEIPILPELSSHFHMQSECLQQSCGGCCRKRSMICASFLLAIHHQCRVSAPKYQPCMFGDGASFENSSVTAVLRHRAYPESGGEKKTPKFLPGCFNAHWMNYTKKKSKF